MSGTQSRIGEFNRCTPPLLKPDDKSKKTNEKLDKKSKDSDESKK